MRGPSCGWRGLPRLFDGAQNTLRDQQGRSLPSQLFRDAFRDGSIKVVDISDVLPHRGLAEAAEGVGQHAAVAAVGLERCLWNDTCKGHGSQPEFDEHMSAERLVSGAGQRWGPQGGRAVLVEYPTALLQRWGASKGKGRVRPEAEEEEAEEEEEEDVEA